MSEPIFLDIYGYRAEVRSTCASARENLAEDFAYFRVEAGDSGRLIELFDADPPYAGLPPLQASVYTPRNVSYRDETRTYIDYSGRALAIHDRAAEVFRIYSRDADLLYEAAYLFLLAQSGEFFDAHGLYRVHALGVSIENRAALIVLPMGGGKSTLGAHLLEFPDIEILSDDSPLIDLRGSVHAFPLRLGLLPDAAHTIPEDRLRRINRMEFGPKLLVNYSYFAGRVRAQAEPAILFLGRRSLSNECTVTKAGRLAALIAMLPNCVIGLGLFQGMEFIFQRSAWEISAKIVVAWRRLRASVRLIRRAQIYHVTLGRDSKENARVVHGLLK
jgi:hypothetical protein